MMNLASLRRWVTALAVGGALALAVPALAQDASENENPQAPAEVICTATIPAAGQPGVAIQFLGTAGSAFCAPGNLYETDPIVGNMRCVPAGSFTQGSPVTEPCRNDDEAQFTQNLAKHLAVMETEVTRQMWADLRAVQPTLPADPTNTTYGSGMTNPVQSNTWYEAILFANLLSVQRGLTRCYYIDEGFSTPVDAAHYQTDTVYCNWNVAGYRLPSEGEWEYLCRAGTTTPFWIKETHYTSATCGLINPQLPQLATAAWFYGSSSRSASSPVGQKAANPWNLRDVHGNVWEWCWDWMDTTPNSRVQRGGGWFDAATGIRSAERGYNRPDFRSYVAGFRLVRSLN